MQNGENKRPASFLAKASIFAIFRATARQQGNSFPGCAWRISQLHRDFSLAFARRFLDLTTFYDKSADDPFTVITFSVSMLHYLSSVFLERTYWMISLENHLEDMITVNPDL